MLREEGGMSFRPEAFWRDALAQDREALSHHFRQDAVIRWHCTNERFTAEEFIRANCDYPGAWAGEIQRAEAVGDRIITATHVWSATDPGLSFHVVSFFRVSGEQIVSLDEYWGDDGPPPQWRRALGLGTPIRPEAGLN